MNFGHVHVEEFRLGRLPGLQVQLLLADPCLSVQSRSKASTTFRVQGLVTCFGGFRDEECQPGTQSCRSWSSRPRGGTAWEDLGFRHRVSQV